MDIMFIIAHNFDANLILRKRLFNLPYIFCSSAIQDIFIPQKRLLKRIEIVCNDLPAVVGYCN